MYVLMVTPNEFPNGDAGSLRDESFAKIYNELGYTPVIICKNRTERTGTYNGIRFISIFRRADSLIKKINRYLQYTKDLKITLTALENEMGKPSLIHLYDATPKAISFIKKYALIVKLY